MFWQVPNVPKTHYLQHSTRIKQDCDNVRAVQEYVMALKYARTLNHN